MDDGGSREGVGLLLSDVMKKNVKDWCEVSSRVFEMGCLRSIGYVD